MLPPTWPLLRGQPLARVKNKISDFRGINRNPLRAAPYLFHVPNFLPDASHPALGEGQGFISR